MTLSLLNKEDVPEKKRTACAALPKGWIREEVWRKGGVSAGKSDVYYFPPAGTPKLRSKPELIKFLGDSVDLSCFDYGSGTMNSSPIKPRGRPLGGGKKTIKKKPKEQHNGDLEVKKETPHSMVPPIRQTASIFKQPVTLVRGQEDSKVKGDLKQPIREKPRQLFWEKRLQGLDARTSCSPLKTPMTLPESIKRIESVVGESGKDTNLLLASISTALHISNFPVVGQEEKGGKLNTNPAVFVSPDQPLISAVKVNDEEIALQEEKVKEARKRLAAAMRALLQ